MSADERSAETAADEEGRQYHIALAPGEVAPFILTCGDPARAQRIAQHHFDHVDVRRQNREFLTFTGTCRGGPMSVIATGIGCDNTEIATIELARIVRSPTFVRVGSCGAVQPHLALEDLVISTGSVRLENTSTWFVHEGFPAVAHWEVVTALVEAAARKVPAERGVHVGLTATGSGFYGAQGRRDPMFPPRFPDVVADLARMNVLNLEMETSTLFTLCAMKGYRAGAVCTIFAERAADSAGRFIAPDRKAPAEDLAIEVAVDALVRLRDA